MVRDDLTIRGNHDRWISGRDPTRMGASDRYAYSQLNQDHRSWLEAPPTRTHLDHGVLACHGTPTDDNQYLIVPRPARASKCGYDPGAIGRCPSPRSSCGHSHQQHIIQLLDGATILNPGSVGCPSYDDPGSDPHVSEVGSPHGL